MFIVSARPCLHISGLALEPHPRYHHTTYGTALRLSYVSNFSLKFAPDSIHSGRGQDDWGRVPK
jgi:hypothetical protein